MRDRPTVDLLDLVRKAERPAVWLSGVAFSFAVWLSLIAVFTRGH